MTEIVRAVRGALHPLVGGWCLRTRDPF